MTYQQIAKNGLWNNNPALVQLLGLCPLLGVSNSFVNAFGLSLATIFVLVLANAIVSIFQSVKNLPIRLPIFVLIIASLTTMIELLMQAFAFELYQILGLFIPLITTNCIVLGRVESFATKNSIKLSAFDGLMNGLGFASVLILLGSIREILGTGKIFANTNLLFPFDLTIDLNMQNNLIFAILPPGAFIILAFIIVAKRLIDEKLNKQIEEIK